MSTRSETMTARTRYFVIVSLLVLIVGLGTGLVAHYVGFQPGALGRRGPAELKFVPVNASLVAYADVQAVMASEVRKHIRSALPLKEDGQRQFQNQTGINIETDIDRVVAFVTPTAPAATSSRGWAMVLARGRFDNVKVEALMREHGAHVEQYKTDRLIVADPDQGGSQLSLAFLEPGLVAIGSVELVRAAIDMKQSGANVTSNEDMMRHIQDIEFGTAWAAGRFDVLTSQAQLPPAFAQQLPPLTWFGAGVQVNGGVRGVVRGEARDEE